MIEVIRTASLTRRLLAAALVVSCVWMGDANASAPALNTATTKTTVNNGATAIFYVPINRSELVTSGTDLSEVIVTDPEVADVYVHGKQKVSVIGKRIGQTTMRLFDANHKLVVFCTEPAIRRLPFNFLTELLATLVLVLGVGAISKVNLIEPIPAEFGAYFVALLVWGIGLSLGGPTGYAINPERDLGPRLAHALLPIHQKRDSDWAYAWVPVLGPLAGAAMGAGLWIMF